MPAIRAMACHWKSCGPSWPRFLPVLRSGVIWWTGRNLGHEGPQDFQWQAIALMAGIAGHKASQSFGDRHGGLGLGQRLNELLRDLVHISAQERGPARKDIVERALRHPRMARDGLHRRSV